MTEPAPIVSVIVPCRNVAGTLVRCLDSIRAALPSGGEIIAVDDGSTDATGEILKAYVEDYACLRVTASFGRGVSAARNAGLALARGTYIQFVDADDTVEEGFCTQMIAAMDRDKADYCICSFWQEYVDSSRPGGEVKLKEPYHYTSAEEIRRFYLPRLIGYTLGDVFRRLLGQDVFARKRELGGVWRCCYRRAIIEQTPVRFDETVTLFEDALFNVEYLIAAHSMTSVSAPLYDYLLDSRTSTVSGTTKDARRYCANKLALLRARKRLDALAGGTLAPLYRGSSVFSLAEIALRTLRGEVPRREGLRFLAAYIKEMFK